MIRLQPTPRYPCSRTDPLTRDAARAALPVRWSAWLAVIVARMSLIVSRGQAANGTLPGSGAEAGPFLVADYADLETVGVGDYGLDKHYRVTADITASASSTENNGQGFPPIGSSDTPFTGSLDGSGHTISGLVIRYGEIAHTPHPFLDVMCTYIIHSCTIINNLILEVFSIL